MTTRTGLPLPLADANLSDEAPGPGLGTQARQAPASSWEGVFRTKPSAPGPEREVPSPPPVYSVNSTKGGPVAAYSFGGGVQTDTLLLRRQ